MLSLLFRDIFNRFVDGYFRTGDIGMRDLSNGNVKIIDRLVEHILKYSELSSLGYHCQMLLSYVHVKYTIENLVMIII